MNIIIIIIIIITTTNVKDVRENPHFRPFLYPIRTSASFLPFPRISFLLFHLFYYLRFISLFLSLCLFVSLFPSLFNNTLKTVFPSI
jgi:hypothetical protein